MSIQLRSFAWPSTLRELDRRWALVGGLAVSACAEPRFTRDIDLAVVVEDDADAERLVHAMLQRGFETLASVKQKSVGRLATIRLTAPPAKRGVKGVVVETLQVAMGVLDSLQQRGTQVGLISHVGDLADRIGAQVRVERVDAGQGLSRVRVFPETEDRPPVSAPTSPGR